MKQVLIDSSIIIDYLRPEDKENTLLVQLIKKELQLAISIMTYFEGFAGKSVWEKKQAREDIEKLFSGMEIMGLDATIARKAGELRARHGPNSVNAWVTHSRRIR